MNEDDIRKAIMKKAHTYGEWTIGITENPKTRKSGHGNPKKWFQWRANTEGVVRKLEKDFLKKGMKGATGGGKEPKYIYIFKKK